MKRRHNLLHEEVLNWSDDESYNEEEGDGGEPAGGAAGGGPAEGGSAELPAPAGPSRPSMPRSPAARPRVIYTENIHEDRLSYRQSRPKRFDMFGDSDSDSASDDDVPALAEPVVPPAPAVPVPPIIAPLIVAPVPHVPVLVPAAPVIEVPVEPFHMIPDADEEDDAGWS